MVDKFARESGGSIIDFFKGEEEVGGSCGGEVEGCVSCLSAVEDLN